MIKGIFLDCGGDIELKETDGRMVMHEFVRNREDWVRMILLGMPEWLLIRTES